MIAGLLVIVPVALTYIVMAFVIGKLDALMAPVVTWIILFLKIPLPEDFHLPGLGFILICFFIFIVGLATANFFGKQLVRAWDYLMHRVPFVRGIYLTIQKVVVAISDPDKSPFNQMVLVHYPHPSSRMIGLVSCDEHGDRTAQQVVPITPPPIAM